MGSEKTQARFADTRQRIIDSARNIILGKGYAAVGLNEILNSAGVPKGSFYHYFKSKDDFGRVLLEEYFDDYLVMINDCLGNQHVEPLQRLMYLFDYWLATQTSDCLEEKCIVVKLCAEVSDLSEQMREVLEKGMKGVQARIGQCIAEAVHAGQLKLEVTPEELARELYAMWMGATLINKVNRTGDSLQLCMAATKRRLNPTGIH